MNHNVGKRYVPKTSFKPKKRGPNKSDNKSKVNYHLLLELNLENLQENLQSDYLHAVSLLFEYFNHKSDVTYDDAMNIIHQLCHHLPVACAAAQITKDSRCIDQLCRFISLLCITHNIEWDANTLNLFISTLMKHVFASHSVLLSVIAHLPNILRTIGHVLFERGHFINEPNCKDLISLLIPLCAPKNKSKTCTLSSLEWIDKHVDKLCIYYGMNKFNQSQNIETFDSCQQIKEYIEECNANKVAIHQKIREVWKYYINVRKFAMVALGHSIIKSGKVFTKYAAIITDSMLVTSHFLKSEFKNYRCNKLCRNEHEFAKSVAPIIRALSHLFAEFDISNDIDIEDEDLIIQIIEDLKDLMILGANAAINNNTNNKTETESDAEHSSSNKLSCDYTEYSKTQRHRFRNRVLLDWNGEQFQKGRGYTSDSVLGCAENLDADKSFFVPFDMFSKLRMYVQHSLGLLVKNTENKAENKYFTHFWNKLLPKDVGSAISQRPFYGSNIFTVLLYDPHPRVRNAACMTLYNILESCAAKMSIFSFTKRSHKKRMNSAITTISDRANETLLAMHRGLIFAIDEKEVHSTPRTQILKCLMLLINITDYNKLLSDDSFKQKKEENILIQIMSVLLRDISQSHGLYKSALIQLLSATFAANYDFTRCPKEQTQIAKLINGMMPVLLQEIKKSSSPNPLSDPRSILSSLSARYRLCLCEWWNKGVQDVIHCGFTPSQHYTIILETMKIMNAWCAIIPLSKINVFNDYNDAMFGFFKLKTSGKNLGIWLIELLHYLNIQQSPDSAAIKSKICMLLSSLKTWQFMLFEEKTRLILLQFLCDAAQDNNWPSLRQCACKGIGNILRCKLESDEEKLFYTKLFRILYEIIENAVKENKMNKKQEYLLVSKACCAVSTICNYNNNDADHNNNNNNKLSMKQLFIYNATTNANDMMNEEMNKKLSIIKQEEEKEEKEYKYKYPSSRARLSLTKLISDNLLISMINAMINVSHETKHNISYNAIRGLGHIAFWIAIEDEKYAHLWPKMCNCFAHSLNNDKKLKNEWNACFAAGAALSNASIAILRDKAAMEATRDLYSTICKLLDKCENYKVKITAVYALSCPASRKNYGPIYYKLIAICCRALNNIDDLECSGFAKQKYKQLLKFRLISLLEHLVNLFYREHQQQNAYDETKIEKLKSHIKLKDEKIVKYCFVNHDKRALS